jgi:hypothetical protein
VDVKGMMWEGNRGSDVSLYILSGRLYEERRMGA